MTVDMSSCPTFLNTGTSMVAALPNFRGGDLKISDQNNWVGPEQIIKFGGVGAKFK